MLERTDKPAWLNIRKLTFLEKIQLYTATCLESCSPGDPVEPLDDKVVYGSISNDPEYDKIYQKNIQTQSLANEIMQNNHMFDDNITDATINRLIEIQSKNSKFVTQDDVSFIKNFINKYPRFNELLE